MTSERRGPPERRLLEARQRLERQIRWMIGIRLVAITSVVLPYFLLRISSPAATEGVDFLYLLAGLTYGATLIYLGLLHLMPEHQETQIYIQFLGDLLLITGMVYYFGGVASPFSVLYFIVIIIASILLPRPAGFAVAATAWLLYAATTLGIHGGWLPSPTALTLSTPEGVETVDSLTAPRPQEVIPGGRLAYSLATHLFGFLTVAFLISHIARDISRAERELAAQREDLADLQLAHRDVIESIPSGLITCDLDGSITSANSAGQAILGRELDDLIGRHLSESGLFSAERWQSLANEESYEKRSRMEVTYDRGDSLRSIGFAVTILRSASGDATGYVVIFQDLSDWRKLQEELRLKDRMVAVGEMASGIAHEVGNPLAAITGSVQMLSSSLAGTESQTKLLGIILKESQRLDRTVKGFLRFARPRERSSVRFDIAALLSENLELLRNSPEVSSRHHLELELDPPAVHLIADPDQISQIFWNLARNALRAMPDEGTLRIHATAEGEVYRVRFIDTGKGMGDEERDKLFHPFHSFFDEGSGIGMAIVYRIVEEHGGRLSVETEAGVGTAITIELPMSYSRELGTPAEVPV